MKRICVIVLVLAAGCHPKKEMRSDGVTTFVAPSEPDPVGTMGTPLVQVQVPDDAPDASVDITGGGEDATVVSDAPPAIPPENETQGEPPDVQSAEEGARKLLAAIKADDPSLARDFFFPAEAFDLVKAMENPRNYWDRLEKYYDEDIHTEHERYWGVHTFEYDSFEMGHCQWKEPLSQGNRIPYWSCRNSRLLARSGTKLFDYLIKYIINWGDRWYVIHLGPIR